MTMAYCALILAGGMGSRMGYREKALIDVNGRPLIMFVIEALEKVVDRIIISVRDREQGDLFKSGNPDLQGYPYAYDACRGRGPLAGILSGLLACEEEYCFIAACDMPFINPNVVELLFRKSDGFEAAIPRWEDGSLEPLHAVYRCDPMIRETRKAFENDETIILAPIYRLKVNYVRIGEIKKIDNDLKTFMNVNTSEDIRQIVDEF